MSDAPMIVHLYDDRRMKFSPWSIGNSKIGSGPGVYTYSRLPGRGLGTCPGSTTWCEANCYAKRVDGAVAGVWSNNSQTSELPPPPDDARLIRIHVSGDFDTREYVQAWIDLAKDRPDVTFFGYTRSYAVGPLYFKLVELRDQPNVQLFASVDPGTDPMYLPRLRDAGWRLSLIDDGTELELPPGLKCPEQQGLKESCDACGYCSKGQRGNVIFEAH